MKRSVGYFLFFSFILATYVLLLSNKEHFIISKIIYTLPFNLLITFGNKQFPLFILFLYCYNLFPAGCYCLLKLGTGLLFFNDCPQDVLLLQNVCTLTIISIDVRYSILVKPIHVHAQLF